MNLHTDQQTLDQWRTNGRWVMFGEGMCGLCIEGGKDVHEWLADPHVLDIPPLWMVEAAKPCEWCEEGVVPCGWIHPKLWGGRQGPCNALCPDCDNGRQRHTITVPCENCARGGGDHPTRSNLECPCLDGSITVPELAVVEWGPVVVLDERTPSPEPWFTPYARVYTDAPDGPTMVSVFPAPDGTVIRIPHTAAASLVGQYAIGGKLVKP